MTHQQDWSERSAAAVAERPDRLTALFAAAGRAVGRDPVDPAGDPHGLVLGTVDDAARAALLVGVRPHFRPEDFAAQLTDLYRHGDDAERRGVLRGLNLLADRTDPTLVPAGLDLVRDALRTNDPRLVSAAMGAFGGAELDDHAWRHGVLKLVFMQVTLDTVADLDRRRDAELARMAESFAAERIAAGRPVPDDVRRLTAETELDRS